MSDRPELHDGLPASLDADDVTLNRTRVRRDASTFVYKGTSSQAKNRQALSERHQLYGEGVAPCGRDAEEYNTGHARRGQAVIFNQVTFDIHADTREGSDADVRTLNTTLRALGFTVLVHKDLRYQELKRQLQNLSQQDHGDCDCLLVVVLTHGLEKDTLACRDGVYKLKRLWKNFTADNCISLAGKPKIFVIQACKGGRDERTVSLHMSRTQTDGPPRSRPCQVGYSIPANADFVFAFSSVEGFYSNRDVKDGSWFIQSLCQELRDHADRYDFLKILTRANRRVATCYKIGRQKTVAVLTSPRVIETTQQMPSFLSTFTRDLYLTPKQTSGVQLQAQPPNAVSPTPPLKASQGPKRSWSFRKLKFFSKK